MWTEGLEDWLSLAAFKEQLGTGGGLEAAATGGDDDSGDGDAGAEKVTYVGADEQVHEASLAEVARLLVSGELDGSTQISSPRNPAQTGQEAVRRRVAPTPAQAWVGGIVVRWVLALAVT